MKALDLTNKQFGRLTALYKAEKRNDKYTRWVCQCKCGNIIEIRTDYLTSGHTTSCGCLKKEYFGKKDITNNRYGKLIALYAIGNGKWHCRCDCGNECDVDISNLSTGNTQSCGCLKSKGELKINNILTESGINFKTQFSFEDCRFPDTNRLAYFDYAIFQDNQLKYLIEYDGTQHSYGWGGDKESLKNIKAKDSFKSYYCYLHNIPLLRLSWKDYEKLSLDFILNKLKDMEEVEELNEEEMSV